jgi:glycosyltransferase A (GT-A) superfamily protein (DUF2064 family)
MCRPHPELFDEIPWSTEAVLSSTLESAEHLGVKTDLLPWRNDLDTFEDLVVFYNKYKNKRTEGPWPGEKTFLYLSSLKKINEGNMR